MKKDITNVPIQRRIVQQIADVIRGNIVGSSRLPINNQIDTLLINGQYVGAPDNMHSYVENGFIGNSTVYAIITFIASKFGSIPVQVYRKTKDQQLMKQYHYLSSNIGRLSHKQFNEMLVMRRKALEPAGDTELTQLIQRPNPLQGTSSFFENLIGFKLITGAGTAWANRAIPDLPPTEIWCLPTQDIVIIVEREDYLVPSGYQLQTNYISNLNKEDVLYWKYWNPVWSTTGSHLYGLSPLRAALLDVDEDNLAKRAAAQLLFNQGAKGVIYAAGSEGLDPGERDAIKMRINEFVNGQRNLGRVEVANANLGYLNLGMDSLQMGIVGPNSISSVTTERLCNIFHFPPPLMSQDNSAYNNYETAMKALMSNKIVPEWVGLRDDLNVWLPPMYREPNLWIEPDFSLVPELQKDMEKLSAVVKNLWQLTPNQALDYLGFETNENDVAMNKHYIPSGFVLLEDVANGAPEIQEDLDTLADEGIDPREGRKGGVTYGDSRAERILSNKQIDKILNNGHIH